MPSEQSAEVKPVQLDRAGAIKAYYEAATKEAKAKVVGQYPFLKEVFSAVNHC